MNLGEFLVRAGQLDEAGAVLLRGLEGRAALYGETPPGYAFGIEPLADLRLREGDATAALALLMPVDIATARKAGRAVGLSLMPLSFATILGGMATLIGTPPNIIIASIREETVGTPFRMFDFAPVGGVAALAGMAFVALIGWRLIPQREGAAKPGAGLEQFADYIAELTVPEGQGQVVVNGTHALFPGAGLIINLAEPNRVFLTIDGCRYSLLRGVEVERADESHDPVGLHRIICESRDLDRGYALQSGGHAPFVLVAETRMLAQAVTVTDVIEGVEYHPA